MELIWKQLIERWISLGEKTTRVERDIAHSLPDPSGRVHQRKGLEGVRILMDVRKKGISNFLGIQSNNCFSSAKHPIPDRSTTYIQDFYEVKYVLEGEFWFGIYNEVVKMKEGELCLMSPQCIHWDLNSGKDSVMVYMLFSKEIMQKISGKSFSKLAWVSEERRKSGQEEQRALFFKSEERVEGISWISQILEWLVREQIEQEANYKKIMGNLAERLLLKLERQKLEQKKVYLDLKKEEIMLKTEYYIQQHLNTVTACKLAENLHYNSRYYNRLIREYYGVTLTEYIQKKRLNEAKRLLFSTDLPINDIIRRVGYQNRHYFYRLFKKDTNMTPQSYRQKYQEE